MNDTWSEYLIETSSGCIPMAEAHICRGIDFSNSPVFMIDVEPNGIYDAFCGGRFAGPRVAVPVLEVPVHLAVLLIRDLKRRNATIYYVTSLRLEYVRIGAFTQKPA